MVITVRMTSRMGRRLENLRRLIFCHQLNSKIHEDSREKHTAVFDVHRCSHRFEVGLSFLFSQIELCNLFVNSCHQISYFERAAIQSSAPNIPRTRFAGHLEDLSHRSPLWARKGKKGGGVGEWAISGERGRGERWRECEQMVVFKAWVQFRLRDAHYVAKYPASRNRALQNWVHMMRINQPHLPHSLHAPC